MSNYTNPEDRAESRDRELKKTLGFWQVMFFAFSSIVGSGWLFSALYASSTVGPASIISWLLGFVLILFLTLVYAELSGMLPKSGAIVRYPHYTHGGLSSFLVAWAYILGAATTPAIEGEAITQYLSSIFPSLTSNGYLTIWGFLLVAVMTVIFFLMNYYSVYLVGKFTEAIGWLKIVIPLTTALLVFTLYFHTSNFTNLPGGFLPYGASSVVLALPTSGIIFSFIGFRQGLEYGGEVKQAQRNVPLGTIAGMLLGAFVYILLQLAFIGGVDWKAISTSPGNWAALSSTVLSNGPFYELLKLSSVPALVAFSVILFVMAVASPLPNVAVYMGTTARAFYGSAAAGNLPSSFLSLSKRKIPYVGLIASLILGIVYTIPYPTWVYIAEFGTLSVVITYIVAGPSLLTLRRVAPDARRPFRLPGAVLISALAFIGAYLIVYWATFSFLWGVFAAVMLGFPFFLIYTSSNRYGVSRRYALTIGIPYWVVLIAATYFLVYQRIIVPYNSTSGAGLPISLQYVWPFVVYIALMVALTFGGIWLIRGRANEEGRIHMRAGLWMLVVLFSAVILSYIGQFGVFKTPIVPFPYDTILAALVSLGLFVWSVRSGFKTNELEVALKTSSADQAGS
ncbi:amino acid permease [Sulfodiicoccus acidiphilus]|uniref:Amino acid permease n=1 Tax=Sulfodiicoccus acidiphilus TaxID=1670455 RepID=A0A348B1I0_9CREN|nr:APC family permease [Sulfodiicoccus acidiphilus]BBD72032.1 amino acid permease [Sulfodiicoccus acidiphilus]GGU00266.1 amino acid permease [Sulfodiicoccus acidiphilus]